MEVTSRSFHDSRNHLLFHFSSPTPSLSLSPLALARCFVAQLYGNCSLTNRLNPLFSFQGEDNHPPRVPVLRSSVSRRSSPSLLSRPCFRFTGGISSPPWTFHGRFSTPDTGGHFLENTFSFFFLFFFGEEGANRTTIELDSGHWDGERNLLEDDFWDDRKG